MEDESKTREEILEELCSLRTRLREVEDSRRSIRQERNLNAVQHAEHEAQWLQEREHERASLQLEKAEHEHSLQDLGKARAQLRDVSFRLLQAEENERKRIAQEIHDSIAQYWITVKQRVELILNQLDLKVARPLEDILPIIHVGIEETHRIQMNLRPALLDSLGILATVNWFTREFQKANPGIEVRVRLDVKEEHVPNPIKSVIYRILQEAFNNVARHSGAHHVDLLLQQEGDELRLAIQDDGKGFDPDAAYSLHDADLGLGLAGMKERAVLAGGSMSIESTHGQGVTLRASWPLP